MKILSVDQIRQADQFTIANEPIASIDLMERAATAIYRKILPKLLPDQRLLIFAGSGNNGGDGLVLARLFYQQGYEVVVMVVRFSEKGSQDFETNYLRLLSFPEVKLIELTELSQIPETQPTDIIIDALFGSGLNKPVQGFAADVINFINQSGRLVISIDIPSGLPADQAALKGSAIIQADYTFTFETVKMAFLFPENEYFAGNWEVISIGLHPDFMHTVTVANYLLSKQMVRSLLKPRSKFSHKGSFGHALLLAGSSGKCGAAVLAATACLRSGAGLLHVHSVRNVIQAIQCSLPEAMTITDPHHECITTLPNIEPYSAIAAGPGMGTDQQTAATLKLLIQNTSKPLLLDADALNIIAENPTWLAFLPAGSILSPHPGEFRRLVGDWADSFEKIQLQQQLSQRFKLYIILKGAHSSISSPSGECWFNTTGNPGMATAGSGDVLTGIILGLLAAGYTSNHAVMLGVFIHGLAGDIAARSIGYESLIASDIIAHLGEAFLELQKS